MKVTFPNMSIALLATPSLEIPEGNRPLAGTN